tara:strand:+ start:72366 stop:72962 length:597 start_codon:yes stop_codon:yes gene_type:complete
MAKARLISLILMSLFLYQGCITTAESDEDPESVYPMFVDKNSNNINDYVEQTTHEPGAKENNGSNQTGDSGHAFLDNNDDGVCDYAQDGSPTWHGPGFIDDNENSICDYWDESHPMHHQHEGMQYHDENDNHINDYMEEETHLGEHAFVDENQDGICDLAQDGSPTWHGPGFTDNDNNGISDHWEQGGRGHGGMMGSN